MATSKSDNHFLYLISLAAYVLALTQPLFTTSGQILGFELYNEQITFFKSVEVLKQKEYHLLSVALLVFVVGLPVLKFITLIFNINGITIISKTIDQFLVALQKYAMVDVFVIALFLIGSKNNPLFILKIEIGTYMLLLSILASIIVSINLKMRGKTAQD